MMPVDRKRVKAKQEDELFEAEEVSE